MKSILFAASFLILAFSILPQAAFSMGPEIVINEVLASNATTNADEDGDFEDWIELYNPGHETINLLGFGLSDDYDNPFRWIFPDVSIAPGEFLLVWASGKDRNDPSASLHTNFSIASAGEEVLITRPDEIRIDELPPTFIPTDVSFGRKPDGGDQWYYFDEPTPGQPNTTHGAEDILEPPAFSKEGGFYSEAFELEISHDDPDVTIIYTLDGSEPCLQNIDGTEYPYKNFYPFYPDDPFGDTLYHTYRSWPYQESIHVQDRSAEEDKLSRITATVQPPDYMPDEPVFKGTVVRARAHKEGFLPSDIITHSYFVNPEGADKFHLPVISINIQENYLFDYQDGIYTPGVDADQWHIDNPGQTHPWPFYGNWRRRGEEWEYPAHVELFEQNGHQRLLAQDLGIRIHGGATRSFPMKSLRLYARNKYSNSHLTHDFFGAGNQSYKRLILRNSGNDFTTEIWEPGKNSRTMFRDAAIQAIVSHMHLDTQAYRPALVFLNGEYWGIQNIRERYDKHYLLRNYGVEEDKLDLLTGKDEAKEGDNLHYSATIHYIEEHGLEDDEHYEYILTRIDAENFIDYQIANIYADNTDWPGNNIDFWRYRTDSYDPGAPEGKDGRWRWLLFDTDFGFGLWGGNDAHQNNTLAFATRPDASGWPNPPWSTFLLRSFLENDTFRTDFINRFADLLNTAFTPERTKSVINGMKAEIAPDIAKHLNRWGYPDAYDDWVEHVGVKTSFAEQRPFYQRKHIKEQFGLESLVQVQLDVDNQLKGYVRINTIAINDRTPGVDTYPYPWTGTYFKDVPVTVEAIAGPGYVFSHWEGDVDSEDPVLHVTPDDLIDLKAHFQPIDTDVVLHYWYFDTRIPNDTPLERLDAFYSAVEPGRINYESSLEGYPYYDGHPLWRKASMERRNMPTILNYLPELNDGIPYVDTEMRGLQVRQPFVDEDRENTLVFDLPTSGFKDILFRFAARNEGAAESLVVDYRVDAESEWTAAGLEASEWPLSHAYQLFEIDFQDVEGVENNEDFQLRLRFAGDDMEADDGNRVTFNNISLSGRAVGAHSITATAGENGTIEPSGRIPVYSGNSKTFSITPLENHQIASLELDGECIIDSLDQDEEGCWHLTLSDIVEDHYLSVSFSLDDDLLEDHEGQVLMYPNPAFYEVTLASKEEIIDVYILTQDGRVVWSERDINSHEMTIGLGSFRNGLYFVRVESAQGVVVKKLQVMR